MFLRESSKIHVIFLFNYLIQYLAIVFVINSWYYLKKECYWQFIVKIIIGSLFHKTALIGFSLLLVYMFRKNLKVIPIILIIS